MTTTVSYYARGDSNSANNAALNVSTTSKVPTTQLTFTSGATGDIKLEFNGGLPDPDTQVILNGNTYNFTVVMVGYLPTTGSDGAKLANVGGYDLRGQRVVVILINGQRYFFLPDMNLTLSAMNLFPNGAIALKNVTTTGGPILICFVAGTLIATPTGERAVESLRAGDLVLNLEGQAEALLWVGHRRLTPDELNRESRLWPVRIPAGLFGPGRPHSPLSVSPQHRIWVEGWRVQLAAGLEAGLIAAQHLVDCGASQARPAAAVDYYHLLFETHQIVLSNGLPSESLQPTGANLRDIAPEARAEFARLFPEGLPAHLTLRPAAAPSLRAHESRLVMADKPRDMPLAPSA